MSTSRERAEIYCTPRWRALRAVVLLEAGHQCERCAAVGRRVAAVLVHHVKTVRERPDLVFTRTNLQALCADCHEAVHAEMEDTHIDPCRKAWSHYLESLMEKTP